MELTKRDLTIKMVVRALEPKSLSAVLLSGPGLTGDGCVDVGAKLTDESFATFLIETVAASAGEEGGDLWVWCRNLNPDYPEEIPMVGAVLKWETAEEQKR